MVNWLNKGKASTAALGRAKKATEVRKKQREIDDMARRFWLEPGDERKITFLDGNLQKNGTLDFYSYWEHNVKLKGKWGNNFVCLGVEEADDCPLCDFGNNSVYQGVFSIVDHSVYVAKSSGKKFVNQRKLFVAKETTLGLLQKLATKYKGLRGVVIEISRSSEMVARVGDQLLFDQKFTSAQLKATKWETRPLDYQKVINFKTAKQLNDMGFGKSDPDEVDDTDDDIDGSDIPF